jgi:hypothetical protein
MNFIKMQIHLGSFMTLLLAAGLILAQPSFTQAQEVNKEAAEEEENDPWEDTDFPFEDDVLLAFFDANQEVSAVNRQSNEKMQETVESFDLTYERFQQIFRALQNGAFTSEEIESFNAAAPQVTSIQRDTQEKVKTIVEEYDMSMQEYRSIMMEFRRDRERQQYVSHLARERAKEKILEERRREAERKMEEERMQQEEENN